MRIDYLRKNPLFASRLAELCGNGWEHLSVDWDHAVALREFETQRTTDHRFQPGGFFPLLK